MTGRNVRRHVLAAVVIGVWLWPAAASAAEVVRTFEGLQGRLLIGETVTATDRSGTKTKGKLRQLTASSILLDTPQGPATLQGDDLTKVQARRSGPLWNGAVIGAAVPTVLIGIAAAQYGCEGGCVGAMAFYGAIGAGVGVGIDALWKGNVTVFQAGASQKARVALGPMVGRGRQGIRCSIAF